MGDPCASRGAKRGQALPLFVIVFIAMIGFIGLAIDGARLYSEHTRLQGAADSAAIGAAHELRRGHARYGRDLLPAALHDAGLHGVDPSQAEIIVHHPPVSGAFENSPDHVEVVVRSELPTTFMAMFGVGKRPVSSRAVAGLVTEASACILALAGGEGALTVEGGQPFDQDCGAKTNAADPYAGLRAPSCVGRSPGSSQLSADGEETVYWPGCYEDPVEIHSGRARLMPGVHVYQRGLRVTGGEVVGEGVSLTFPASPDQAGVALEQAARASLSAPSTGELSGVLMQAAAGGAAWTANLQRAGGSELEGALLFPGRTLRWAPNEPSSGAWNQVVAERVAVLEALGGRAIHAAPAGQGSAVLATLVE